MFFFFGPTAAFVLLLYLTGRRFGPATVVFFILAMPCLFLAVLATEADGSSWNHDTDYAPLEGFSLFFGCIFLLLAFVCARSRRAANAHQWERQARYREEYQEWANAPQTHERLTRARLRREGLWGTSTARAPLIRR